MKKYRSIQLLLITWLLVLSLAACSLSGAEAQVSEDLESMRNIGFDQDTTEEIMGMLDEDGREDFADFLSKAGAYEFRITGSTETDENTTIVTVRIRTYCFGREYLKAWNEYLEVKGEGDFDQAGFYEMMMERLGDVEDKTFTQEVEVTCTDSDGDGVWETDTASNYPLRNAMLGGLLGEIASLVDIGQ
ncbi:MAG: hypothetical protein IJH43_01510 [Mogibacterium sp.]|nr:hypothetical protein [Mogibacterium sp.]